MKASLAIRLKNARAGKSVSLSKASAAIGITKGHLWELEHGMAVNPTLRVILAICKYYDIKVQELTKGL